MTPSTRPRAIAPANKAPATYREPTLIEEYESEPSGAQELAAAQFALSIEVALRNAFQRYGCTAAELAETLGVSESAVSQVLNSGGNMRVSTIGRYARAMGYQACVSLHPAEPGVARQSSGGSLTTAIAGSLASSLTVRWLHA